MFDDYGFPASVDPYEAAAPKRSSQSLRRSTASAAPAPSKRPRRTTARRKRNELKAPPRWFVSDKAQAAAEFIAFNVAIDRLLGVTPSLDMWPYSEFKPKATSAFLAKLATIP